MKTHLSSAQVFNVQRKILQLWLERKMTAHNRAVKRRAEYQE